MFLNMCVRIVFFTVLFSFASASFAVKGKKELEKQEEDRFDNIALEMFPSLMSTISSSISSLSSNPSSSYTTDSDEYRYPDTTFETDLSDFDSTTEMTEMTYIPYQHHRTYQDYRHSDWSSASTYSSRDMDAMVHASNWIEELENNNKDELAGPSEPSRRRYEFLSRLRAIRQTAFLALRSFSPVLFR